MHFDFHQPGPGSSARKSARPAGGKSVRPTRAAAARAGGADRPGRGGSPGQPDRLSRTFSALADPTRREILELLAGGEKGATELAERFADRMSQPAITRHLKVLERAGLISRRVRAQFRLCNLEAAPLAEASGWIEEYRKFWDESFDRLDEYLQQLKGQFEPGTRIIAVKRDVPEDAPAPETQDTPDTEPQIDVPSAAQSETEPHTATQPSRRKHGKPKRSRRR